MNNSDCLYCILFLLFCNKIKKYKKEKIAKPDIIILDRDILVNSMVRIVIIRCFFT